MADRHEETSGVRRHTVESAWNVFVLKRPVRSTHVALVVLELGLFPIAMSAL